MLTNNLTADEALLGDAVSAKGRVRAESVDGLRETVRQLADEGTAVYPQGGRTSLDYGGVPSRPGVAIDLTGLDRVIAYPAADMTITVEAGIRISRLREVLAESGQRLPLDVARADEATLGGVYATNSSGARRFGAGRPRDFIIGISFVTADGTLGHGGGRVVKNVAGYDFPKLMTGSMGTLAIISELTLKVLPKPEATEVVWIGVDGPVAACDVVARGIELGETRAIAAELLNADALARVRQARVSVPGTPWCVAFGMEGSAATIHFQREAFERAFAREKVHVARGDEAEPSWQALEELTDFRAFPLALVATMRPTGVQAFVAAAHEGGWTIQAHAASGIVRLGKSVEAADTASDVATEVAMLRGIAAQAGGAVVVAGAPADWKPVLNVWGDARNDWVWMEGLKQAFDPKGVLNPGRFVGRI